MRKFFLFTMMTALVVLGACSSQQASTPVATAPAASGTTAGSAVGSVPFDYPVVAATGAKAGDYVLTITSALGGKDDTYIFYDATMVEPGTGASKIKSLGDEMTVPNSLIIPLARGAQVKPGDVVLTWWQSGSGMERAIVTGGSATQPKVRYLDMEAGSSSDKEETLQADTFVKIADGWNPGVTVGCMDSSSSRYGRYELLSATDSKVLVSGWAGSVKSFNRSSCFTVPVVPTVKVGDTVYVPSFGEFTSGTVTKVNSTLGRVSVKYQFGGEDKEVAVAYGDVATKLQ